MPPFNQAAGIKRPLLQCDHQNTDEKKNELQRFLVCLWSIRAEWAILDGKELKIMLAKRSKETNKKAGSATSCTRR